MAAFDSWEAYFYPEPDNATMRNIENIRDPEELRQFEYGATALRQTQLRSNLSLIDHTFDAAHVRAIHHFLFQDVYEWAGQFRTINTAKVVNEFADPTTGAIDSYLSNVHRLIADTHWGRLEHGEFAAAAAEVFAYRNQAHPFREGNGRMSKVFMTHLAEKSQFQLDLARVSPEVWNQATMLSGPDLGTYAPVPDSLVPVFQLIAVAPLD